MLSAAPMSFAATRSNPSVSIRILRVARPIRPNPLMATRVMNILSRDEPRRGRTERRHARPAHMDCC